jgi:hypothetical protein
VQSASTVTRIYDTDPTILYTGATAKEHVLNPMPNPYGTFHAIADGGTATYSCSACTRLAWNSRPGLAVANASATVTLTDAEGAVVDTATIDTAGPVARPSQGVYDSGVRPAGNYTLTITAASGSTVALDSIDVTALVPTLIDDGATHDGDTVSNWVPTRSPI